ncbi:MAG TPA: hypothetical protein VGL62_09280, partial [Vicinamibacterales bacterium]|jgi:hypothetical protein
MVNELAHRRLLALAASAVPCLFLAACGSGGEAPASSSASAASTRATVESYRHGDADSDDEHGVDDRTANDDEPFITYGRAANAGERQNITALLKSYYDYAEAGNAVKACALVYSRLATDPALRKTVPEDRYSRPVRVHASPGESCARVASRLFKRRHLRLTLEAPTLRVLIIRVKGAHGLAIMGFRTEPEQWIPIAREGSVWKVHAFLAGLLP